MQQKAIDDLSMDIGWGKPLNGIKEAVRWSQGPHRKTHRFTFHEVESRYPEQTIENFRSTWKNVVPRI